jgi:hypothetical protein
LSSIALVLNFKPDLFTTDTRVEVGKRFGGGAKYKRIWDLMNPHKKMAKLLQDAYEQGIDPMTIELGQAFISCIYFCQAQHILFNFRQLSEPGLLQLIV